MTRPAFILACVLLSNLVCASWCDTPSTASNELSQGVQAYQQDRWMTAMGHFVHVLAQDPSNAQAHAYLSLVLKKLEAQQVHKAHEDELAILTATSKLLEDRRMDTRIVDEALRHSNAEEEDRQRYDRHAQCTMAQMEAQLGRLPEANDLVFQALAQNPNDAEALRLLSDLQSQIRQTLDTRKDLSVPDRRTLEGFYAYGQADYASAATAWGQARSALEQSQPGPAAADQVALLHFESYEKIARAHVNEELEAARIRVLFGDGVAAYENQDFDKALSAFRQVALASPTYPQLGQYLVQSEAAVERKRTSDLSDAKRQEATQAFAKGLASLEKGDYVQAKTSFEAVLALDPAHPQAKLYLQQIESQKTRPTDPAAGQQHYEAGLIAFVGGDMEQAIREWHIALRFDPENPKVTSALNKVQRELVSANELP